MSNNFNWLFLIQVLATCFVRKIMDNVFTQEELFWLDDILPGTKVGRIRRTSAARNVHIPKSKEDYNDPSKTVNQFFASNFQLTKKTQTFSASNR